MEPEKHITQNSLIIDYIDMLRKYTNTLPFENNIFISLYSDYFDENFKFSTSNFNGTTNSIKVMDQNFKETKKIFLSAFLNCYSGNVELTSKGKVEDIEDEYVKKILSLYFSPDNEAKMIGMKLFLEDIKLWRN